MSIIAEEFTKEEDNIEALLVDDLTSETGYNDFDVVMDELIGQFTDVNALITFESAIAAEEDPEKLMEMYAQLPHLNDEDITVESAVAGKEGFLNKLKALKDKVISNVEENSSLILDIVKNHVGDSVTGLEKLKDKIEKSEANTLKEVSSIKTKVVNSYLGVFTAMGLDINNSADVIKFINLPTTTLVPLYKEHIGFIKSLNDAGKNKTTDKIMSGEITKGSYATKFFTSLKNVPLKDLNIYYGFPIKLTGINCSFATVHLLEKGDKKRLTMEVDAVSSKAQQPKAISKADAIKIIDATIAMVKANQKLNVEVKNMLSEISKFLAFFRGLGSTAWGDLNPLDPNQLGAVKGMIGFYGTISLSGKLTQHYLVATKNLAKSNYDMKNFVTSYISATYK